MRGLGLCEANPAEHELVVARQPSRAGGGGTLDRHWMPRSQPDVGWLAGFVVPVVHV